MDGSPLRKSGRQRQQTQRYSSGYVDPTLLDDDSDAATPPAIPDDDDSGDAFDPDNEEEVVEEELEMDDGILDDDASSQGEGGSVDEDDDEEEDGRRAARPSQVVSTLTPKGPASFIARAPRPHQERKSFKYGKKGPTGQLSMREDQSYSRGLLDPKTKGSKEAVKLFLFGPAVDDQQAALRGAYRWRSQLLLPSRKADKSGAGGFVRSFYVRDSDRIREVSEEWRWYDEQGGRKAFKKHAVTVDLDQTAASSYIPVESSLDVIMGPNGKQTKFTVPVRSVLDLNTPFARKNSVKSSNGRSGWLLNLGDRVQSLAWAPNQSGSSQFLLVATAALVSPGIAYLNGQPENLSHFEPQTRSKSSLQIWEFRVASDGRIDNDRQPRLRQVICTDWGETRSVKWCPTARKTTNSTGNAGNLGLLAGIWGDGALRVLDIDLADTDTPQYVRIVKAALTIRPHDSVFSSFTWLSSHGLAIGASIGTVGIYNISDALLSGSDSVEPTISSTMHDSYIISLISCAPSRPHILVASAMSGYVSMTDLHRVSPTTGFNASNTIFSQRSRMGRVNITWHDWSQEVLNTDDLNSLSGMPLRRFHAVSGLSKYRGAVRALATSEVHPFVAAAGYGGEVTFCNPMKRVLSPKEDMYNIRWFVHTWRRDRVPDTTIPGLTREGYEAPYDIGTDDAGDAASRKRGKSAVPDDGIRLGADRQGVVRIVEGFKAEAVSLAKASGDKDTRGPIVPATVYEAQTAMTTAAWNNNLHVGGWIAVGAATGLVRIEDVATG